MPGLVLSLRRNVPLPAEFDGPPLRRVWEILLTTGGTEDDLAACVEASGDPAGVIRLFFLLAQLDREGLVLRSAVDGDGTRIATLEPEGRFIYSPPRLPHDRPLVLSRFALFRRDGADLIAENPTSAAAVRLHDNRAAAAIAALARPTTRAALENGMAGVFSSAAINDLATVLAAAGIVTGENEEVGPLRMWEFHDLVFHAASRRGRHDRPWGGTERFHGVVDPLPPVKQSSRPLIPLPEPAPPPAVDFFTVLACRRSIRGSGSRPVDLERLGAFLRHVGRIKGIVGRDDAAGRSYDVVYRPSPSGGGCAELEMYPAVAACAGLPRGLYRYDPLRHALEEVSGPSAAFERLLDDATAACGSRPQVLFIIAARFGRVSWKYESIAYALILKDVGCLLQTMYMVATALGLAPCALGVGDADLFAEVAGTDYYEETSVGEFVLSSLPDNAEESGR